MSTEKLKIVTIQSELLETYREAMAEYFEEAGCIETAEEILDYTETDLMIHALTNATNHWLKELWELKKEADQH